MFVEGGQDLALLAGLSGTQRHHAAIGEGRGATAARGSDCLRYSLSALLYQDGYDYGLHAISDTRCGFIED